MSFLEIIFGKKRINQTFVNGTLSAADREQISLGWSKIEELSTIAKPSTLREAVIEADKLVDFVLDRLFPGREGAAERLKAAREKFATYRTEYENLWYAHKIRNEMVHKVGFELPSVEAKNILNYFRRSLEILGAL